LRRSQEDFLKGEKAFSPEMAGVAWRTKERESRGFSGLAL
jgi:hypothetical protein